MFPFKNAKDEHVLTTNGSHVAISQHDDGIRYMTNHYKAAIPEQVVVCNNCKIGFVSITNTYGQTSRSIVRDFAKTRQIFEAQPRTSNATLCSSCGSY